MKVKNQIAFSSKNSGKEYMNQQTSIPFPCQKMNQIFVCFFQVKQPRYFHEDVWGGEAFRLPGLWQEFSVESPSQVSMFDTQ